MADYKLSDFLGVAGATIGIIIAGGIMMGNLTAKYVAIVERFRGITGEYRRNDANEIRRGSLETQISAYGRQVLLLNYATSFTTLGVFVFLVTVGLASLSVMFPGVLVLRSLGTIGLFLGLASIMASV